MELYKREKSSFLKTVISFKDNLVIKRNFRIMTQRETMYEQDEAIEAPIIPSFGISVKSKIIVANKEMIAASDPVSGFPIPVRYVTNNFAIPSNHIPGNKKIIADAAGWNAAPKNK